MEKETLVLDLAESEVMRSHWEHWWVFVLLTALCKQGQVILLGFHFLGYSVRSETCESASRQTSVFGATDLEAVSPCLVCESGTGHPDLSWETPARVSSGHRRHTPPPPTRACYETHQPTTVGAWNQNITRGFITSALPLRGQNTGVKNKKTKTKTLHLSSLQT